MMARYRKVESRIWNDAKFLSLSDDGKIVFLLLLTHPSMTSVGAMRSSLSGLAEEMLGWLPERLRKGFGEAFLKGMVKHDEKACLIVLPNFMKYNAPESPNVVKSWSASLELLPECALKTELLQSLKAFTEGLSEGFREAFEDIFRKSMPNPEPEPEPEPEKEDIPPLAPPLPKNSDTTARGSRLPSDWSLPRSWADWAISNGHMRPIDEANRFADYWRSQPGAKGRKSDWEATWRNWIRRSLEGGRKPARNLEPTGILGALVRLNQEDETCEN